MARPLPIALDHHHPAVRHATRDRLAADERAIQLRFLRSDREEIMAAEDHADELLEREQRLRRSHPNTRTVAR